MDAFAIVFARELEYVHALMCVLTREYHEETSAIYANFVRMFPANGYRCGLCRRPPGCGCMIIPMQRERARMLTVPAAVDAAGEAITKLRMVSKATRDAWKECRTHAGMTAVVAQYHRDSLSLAHVRAAESVVGPAVHCHVGECSRCHGTIHECACRMFTCRCVFCIWHRRRMRESRATPGEEGFEDYVRIPSAELDAVAPPGAMLRDGKMNLYYHVARSGSYARHMSFKTAAAVAVDRAARGYDAALDSDDTGDATGRLV